MNTKIFCDIAELDLIKKFYKKNIVKGFTTNPSLMRKAGAKDYKLYSKKILKICNNKPVSLEVFADEYGEMKIQAMKIFKENFVFGVGIKNFRHESGKKIYENREYLLTDLRQATHPHQIHHEFLSETGIFGYSCFLIFILSSIYLGFKSYLKTKNLYQLSAIIFVITSLLPLLPSGSFLSTYVSGIFWLNFAIMNSYIHRTKLNFNKI